MAGETLRRGSSGFCAGVKRELQPGVAHDVYLSVFGTVFRAAGKGTANAPNTVIKTVELGVHMAASETD